MKFITFALSLSAFCLILFNNRKVFSQSTDPHTTESDYSDDDESDEFAVSTKPGIIRCNISNTIEMKSGYLVTMSFLSKVDALASAKEYTAKYKLTGEPLVKSPDSFHDKWHYQLPDDKCIQTPDGIIKFSFTFIEDETTLTTLETNKRNELNENTLTPEWAYSVEYGHPNDV